MQPRGKMMLKVVGIIMIVGGALSLFYSLIVAVGGAALMNLSVNGRTITSFQTADLEKTIAVIGILGLISGAIELTTGIIGCANAAKAERANLCMVFGIISCAMTIISVTVELLSGMLSFAGNGVAIISALGGLMLGLVLPVLFLVGSIMNKKSNLQAA